MEGLEAVETWSVVKFLEENSVSVVPTKWINNNECLWPPFPNREKVTQAIKSQLINTCWPSHKVSVFRNSTHDDYTIAQAKSRKAEETSDLTSSSEEDIHKRKRRTVRHKFSSDEEEEAIYYKTPPTLKKQTEKDSNKRVLYETNSTNNHGIGSTRGSINENIQTASNSQISETNNTNNHGMGSMRGSLNGNIQTPSSSQIGEAQAIPATPLCNETCSCCPHIAKYLKEILRQQHLTRSILNDICHKIDEKKPQEIETHSSAIFKEFNLPFKTRDELMEFDNTFKQEDKFSEAVREIAKFGGNTTYDFVKRALSFFLTNEVAVEYSWLGRRTKNSFSTLTMAQLVIGAAEKAKSSSDKKAVENEISKWLRRAGDWKKSVINKYFAH